LTVSEVPHLLPPVPPKPPIKGERRERGCEHCAGVFYREAAYAGWERHGPG